MSTISITETAVPIVKSSLHLHQKLLRLKLRVYNNRLKVLEKKHKMSTLQFLKRLRTGMVNDEAYVVEWEYVVESCQLIKDQLNELQRVKI